MTKEKHNNIVANVRSNEAAKHLRVLRKEYAKMLIKICDGNLPGALKAILKAYGSEYGDNKTDEPYKTYKLQVHFDNEPVQLQEVKE